MATQKFTQAAPAASVNDSPKVVSPTDPAIEALLAEIASTAYLTEHRFRSMPANDDAEASERQADELRFVVARLGWMADVALQRLGSINTMYNGHAEQWLLPPLCTKALLAGEVRS